MPVYLSQDEEGEPVYRLDWTLDDLDELLQENLGLKQPDQTPPYSLQAMSATGGAKANYADLTVQFTVLVRHEDPVRIPLRLDQAKLYGEVQYDGPGQPVLNFEEDGQGYVCRLQGKPGEQHHLVLRVLVPLFSVGDETRLRLSVPRVTSSNLKLKVPLADAVGEASDRAILVGASAAGDEATELEVQGLAGDFELTWRKAEIRTTQVRPVLQAVGQVLIGIDGQVVNTEATLTIRGFGNAFDRFHVRLPKGAELIPGKPTGYSVVPVSSGAGKTDEAQLLEIRLSKKKSEQQISLTTRQLLAAADPTQWFELGGFEVTEAVQQWGNIAVDVAAQWNVFWGPKRGVEQVDQLLQTAWDEELVAGFDYSFRYSMQPYSLTARVAPKRTRITVEPEYLLLVDEDQVRLEATLKYTAAGAEVSALDVGLPDWQFDDAGPYDLVAVGGIAQGRSGGLSIPLAEPVVGQFEITIRAHRQIDAGTSSLSLLLPRPMADLVDPATVEVLPAENVELAPRLDQMVGLVPQQAGLPMMLPERRLCYRGEAAEAVFVADLTVHEQSISVDVTSRISLLAGQERVEQKLAYTINYQPLEQMTIDVPRGLIGSQGLKAVLEGQPLSLGDLPDQVDSSDTSAPVRKRIALPKPWLGRCELVVSYPIEVERLQPRSSILCTVPLVMPGEGELSSNKLYVSADPGVEVKRVEGPWIESPPELGPLEPRDGLWLSAAEATSQVTLGASLIDPDALGSTTVHRAWVQTWIANHLRQDRAVFSLISDQKNLELVVPGSDDLDWIEVELDHTSVQTQETTEKTVRIPLPDASTGRPHCLEVRYRFRHRRPWQGQLSIELPRLAGNNVWVRRMYWQLVLPRNQHVVVAPEGLTPEFYWGWNGAFWGRIAKREQAELETWSGAAHQPLVPMATSRYLFSSLGPIQRVEVRTASRSLIVLVASGITLLAGLLLIYVRLSRHPLALLLVAVLLLPASLLYPGPALLALEAASLGVALTLLAGLLQRGLGPARWGTTAGEASSAILDKGSTQSFHRPPLVGSQEPTQTAPAAALPLPCRDGGVSDPRIPRAATDSDS